MLQNRVGRKEGRKEGADNDDERGGGREMEGKEEGKSP